MQYRSTIILLLALGLVCQIGWAYDTATLVVGGEKPFFHISPVVVDGAVYASLPALNTLGVQYDSDSKHKQDDQKVEVTTASGDRFTVRAKLIDDQLMIPIQEVASKLDAVSDWNPASRILSLKARIKGVTFDGQELHVTTSYPVTYKVTWWGTAKKLILDMNGVHMPVKVSEVPITNSTTVPVRAGVQAAGQTGRLVLDLSSSVKWKAQSPPKTSDIVISISGMQNPPVSQDSSTIKTTQSEVIPMDSSQQTPGVAPATITGVDFHKDGSRRVDIYVNTSGPVKYETSLTHDPDELMVDFKNAALDKAIDDIFVGHDILQGIHVGQSGDTVRLTLDLNRIVGFDVKRDDSSRRFTVSLVLPKGADGSLAGKSIVIDPGHGGSATGAVGLDGSFEKDANFAIAKRVRDLLLEAGVCAVLTRDNDSSLDAAQKADLEKRAVCAARHSADAFLSIHGNSVSGPRCPTGLESYYHGYDMNGKALAYCVHSEIVGAGLLPDLRVRSDFMLYQTGLGVLRTASERFSIPAALIEVGYVRHPGDLAKREDPAFQQKVAEAVVRGFKEYFEGNSRPTKRSIARPDSKPSVSQEKPKQIETPREAVQPDTKPTPKTEKPEESDGPKRPGETR